MKLTQSVLMTMLASVPDALIAVDSGGQIVFVNDQGESLFGWRRDDLVGQGIETLVPDRFVTMHPAVRAGFFEHPTTRPMAAGLQLSARRRDGSEFPAEISLSAFDVDAETWVLAAIRDVTAARQSERDRERREAIFEQFANTTEVGFVLREAEALLYLNASARRAFGLDHERANTGLADLMACIHVDDRAPVNETRAALDRGSSTDQEFRVVRADGEVRWLRSTNDAVANIDGGIQRVASTVFDITERKAAEADAEVSRLEAVRANAAKDEFLSRMSHELRTPLNAILGFGQLLEMDELTGDQEECVKQILGAGSHLLGLVDEVLDIACMAQGEMRLSLEYIALSEVLDEVLGMVRPLAERREVRVAHSVMSDVVLFADRQRLKQALMNLIVNAVKYNRLGGTVHIGGTLCERERFRVTITDTGSGIASTDMGRLFTPFERLRSVSAEVEGTGLGLAVTRLLVNAMNGEVGVTSQVGEGSSFWIELPAVVVGPAELTEASALHSLPPTAGHEPKRVLYVEDNPSNIRLLERVMARRPEVNLLVATHGRLGVELAIEHRPDLILLDLGLPDISGEEVLRTLHADSRTATIPIIVISADAIPARPLELLALGASGYLTKPFDISRLLTFLDQPIASWPGGLSDDHNLC